MKKLIYFIALVLMMGCSSNPKKETTSQHKTSEISPKKSIESAPTVEMDLSEPESGLSSKETDSSSADLYSQLSQAIKSDNESQIQKYISQILARDPKDTKALNALALHHYSKGRQELAKLILLRALVNDKNNPALHTNLGVIYLKEGERRDAIRSFRKALEESPSDPFVAANLGSIYASEKDYNKAIVALEIAYNKGYKDFKILNNYGVALAATGKSERAEKIYQEALANQQSNREILMNYAILLIDNLKKYDEGLDVVNKLKFIGPPEESRNLINALENKAKNALK